MSRIAATLFALALLMAGSSFIGQGFVGQGFVGQGFVGQGFVGQGWAAERTITTGQELAKTYTLPAGYTINRVYYSLPDNHFILGLQSPQNTAHYFQVTNGQWTTQAPDTDRFLTLPPYGAQMLLSSRLLRATTPQNFDQPFGAYRAALFLSENRYTKKAGRSGRYGATVYEETLGNGTAYFKVTDEKNDTVLMVEEAYRGNSADTLFLWTPDGRHIVMIPPRPTLKDTSQILIAGPFPVQDAARLSEVNLRNSTLDRLMQDDDRFLRGEISADQRYDFPFEAAITRLLACKDFLNHLGRPDQIMLNNPLHALSFGDEGAIIGMRFRFGFRDDGVQGEIEIASPLRRTASGHKRSLEDYFTVVTISKDKDKTDVFCPL